MSSTSVSVVLDGDLSLAESVEASVGVRSGVSEELGELLLVEAILVSLHEIIVHPLGSLEDATSKVLEDLRSALLDLSLGYETTSGVVAHLPGLGGGVFDDSSVAVLSSGHSLQEVVHSTEFRLVGMSQDSVDIVSISVDNASSEADSGLASSELRSRDKTTSGSVAFLEGPHGSVESSASDVSVSEQEIVELGKLLLVETIGAFCGELLEGVLLVSSESLESTLLE
jgi:hypothetical protein